MTGSDVGSQARYEIGLPTGYDDVVGFSKVIPAFRELDRLPHPDFLLFQSLHMMTEICWYEMHYELGRAASAIDRGEYRDATGLISRSESLQRLSCRHVDELRTLIPQTAFLQIRDSLPRTDSGLDSSGAINLRRVCRTLRTSFARAIELEGLTTSEVLTTTAAAGPTQAALHACALALMALDDGMMDWQERHRRLVWSRIGGHPSLRERALRQAAGTSGRPVDMLDKFVIRLAFPELWRASEQVAAQRDET